MNEHVVKHMHVLFRFSLTQYMYTTIYITCDINGYYHNINVHEGLLARNLSNFTTN